VNAVTRWKHLNARLAKKIDELTPLRRRVQSAHYDMCRRLLTLNGTQRAEADRIVRRPTSEP
jgi:hypothetical protein